MLKGAVAKRYAQALFEVGEEKELLDQFLEDLAAVSQVLTHPDLARALDNPKIPLSAKKALVRRFLGDRNPYIFNFVDLIVSKNRASLAGQIHEAYQRLFDAHRGIMVAEVTTAIPLSESEKEMVVQRLSEITGKRVALELRVDPAILGGLVARIGDQVIDGSTIAKLKALRAEMAGAV